MVVKYHSPSRPQAPLPSLSHTSKYLWTSSNMDISNFPHLLKSNAIPTELELLHIRDIISREEHIQLTLDNLITPVQQWLDKLLHQRKESLILLHVCRPIASVVRRIPPDVLSSIFAECISAHNSNGEASPVFLRQLLPISHVCSLWRCVAIRTAKLWTSVSLRITARNFENAFDPLASLWARTYTMPLALSLQFPVARWLSSIQHKQPNFPPQSAYIQTLNLKFPLSAINSVLRGTNLPRLETLTITGPDDRDYRETLTDPITVFDASINLRQFSFDAGYVLRRDIQQDLHLPWSKLTSLRIFNGGATYAALFCILKQCTSLIQCIVRFTDTDEPLPHEFGILPHAETIVLPALRTLWITHEMSSPEFFNAFTFPALDDFGWVIPCPRGGGGGETHDPPHLSVFRSLQHRSQFDLKTLALYGHSIPLAGLLSLIVASPSLAKLELCGDPLGESVAGILQALVYDPARLGGDGNVALCLEEFGVFCSPGENKGCGALDRDQVVRVRGLAEAVVRSRRVRWGERGLEGVGVAYLRVLKLGELGVY